MQKEAKLIIWLLAVGFLLGLLIGYVWGGANMAKWGIRAALAIAEKQGINITIDENMLTTGFLQYRDNIGGCLFIDGERGLNGKMNGEQEVKEETAQEEQESADENLDDRVPAEEQ